MTGSRVVLHVGMQQSGATMLQRALSRLRPQLRAHGVAYIGHRRIRTLPHVAGWHNHGGADRSLAGAFERELAAAADHEIRRTAEVARAAGTLLVSSDHLVGADNLGRADADCFRAYATSATAQALAALDASEARLVLYTHRQDRLMELCYLREVAKGEHHTFAQQFPYRFKPVLDYADLVERLAALPAVRDVVVRPFELLGDDPLPWINDFLDVVGLRDALDLRAAGADLAPHRVLSRRALKIALAMTPHVDTARDRRLIRDFLLEHFPATSDRETRFVPKRVRRQILEAYEDTNRHLFRTYMPNLPEDGYATNAATERLATLLPAVSTRADANLDRPARPVSLARRVASAVARGAKGAGAAAARLTAIPSSVAEAAKRSFAFAADRNRLVYRCKVRFLARRCDVFLLSFPKCGRTWLRVMLAVALSDHFGVKLGNPLRFTTARVTHPRIPRVLATHDDSPHLKPAARVMRGKRAYCNARVILLVRDPRDAVVSLYFHMTHRLGGDAGTLSDFSRAPDRNLASLLAFYDAWAEQRNIPRDLMVVRYEDLHADPRRELRRVLAFLGVPDPSEDTVERAVAASSFERLQRLEASGGARTHALRTATTGDPESYKVRRGKVGGFVDYLSADDIASMEAQIRESVGARAWGYGL